MGNLTNKQTYHMAIIETAPPQNLERYLPITVRIKVVKTRRQLASYGSRIQLALLIHQKLR